MKNFWKDLPKPILALAPMAGITDSAFRQMCRKYGADVVYSEMASASALFFKPQKTLELVKFSTKERPYVIQLFGKNPEHFAKAAKIISDPTSFSPFGKGRAREGFDKFSKSFKSSSNPPFLKEEVMTPDGIDINFGCPARKVFAHGSGCALMNDVALARKIISAVCENTSLPVSIKIRAGVGKITAEEFIEKIKDLPFSAVMVHGRTYEEGFSGPADFEVVENIKKIIPDRIVLGNGGITEPRQAKEILEKYPALDGLGIARGALGRPQIFEEIKKACHCERSEAIPNYKSLDTRLPQSLRSFAMTKHCMLEHAKLLYKTKGEKGMLEIRKHLAWYVKGFPNASELRQKLVQVKNIKEIEKILGK